MTNAKILKLYIKVCLSINVNKYMHVLYVIGLNTLSWLSILDVCRKTGFRTFMYIYAMLCYL